MSHRVIENDFLKVSISSNGAELQNIFNKKTQLECLWDGNPNFWGKKSPILFPIVGGLKNNRYLFQEKTYQLNRHGFARDYEFSIVKKSNNSVCFKFTDSDSTKESYPFKFSFLIEYKIVENKLFCSYTIENNNDCNMYFSVGAHPAFKIPLENTTNFSDWFLEFEQNENADIFPLTDDGLLKTNSIPFLNHQNKLNLTKELFYKDALVFKDLKSESISLRSEKSNHGLKMNFKGFPFFGIWSAKDADFICLEPWCGIADSEKSNGGLVNKEGINLLEPSLIFTREWSVELF